MLYGDIVDLLDFINKSPSPWHTAMVAGEQLENAGFKQLDWDAAWEIEAGGRYYVRLYGAMLAAFTVGNGSMTKRNSLRIEAAKELLADPSLRIGEICEMVGYADTAHFPGSFESWRG